MGPSFDFAQDEELWRLGAPRDSGTLAPMPDIRSTPNTIPWPPILFAGTLVAASLLGSVAPLRLPLGPFGELAGWCLILLALGLMGWAFLTFKGARANILPHRAAGALLTSGPFALSRNPIYLSEAMLMAGFGFTGGSLWWWLLLPVFVMAVTRLAVVREEAHMAAKFGPVWEDYASRVRRWL